MKTRKGERQNVYLSYRKLFSGENARVRSEEAILRILGASPDPLGKVNTGHRRVKILISLLHKGIFETEEAARAEFPDLWAESCPKQSLSKTPMKGSRAHRVPTGLKQSDRRSGPAKILNNEKSSQGCGSSENDVKLPKISYAVQHRILGTTQQILEASCYGFTCKWFPSVLADRAWSCAAALELTKWLHVMNDRLDTVSQDCFDEKSRKVFREIRPRLALLRHSAVHRLYLEQGAFLEQIHAALMLTEILHDYSSRNKLQAVYTLLGQTVAEMERSTEAIQQDVSQELLTLQKQKDELNQREHQLRESIVEQFLGVSKEADRSLLGCIDDLLDADKLESGSQKDTQSKSSDIYVDEDDIESDEDQLLTDLE